MAALTYTNSKISSALVGEDQQYQGHITSAGLIDTATLAAECAANLKDSDAYIKAVAEEIARLIVKHISEGERVTIDGIVRLEPQVTGAFDFEDSPWNPAVNAISVAAIPYEAVKTAAKDLVPENALKPLSIAVNGTMDKTTMESGCVTKGNTLLVQGKGLRLTAANLDEGLFVVDSTAEHTYRLNVSACTAATIDATVGTDVPAGTYTLILKSRDGYGTNRMVQTVTIAGFIIKEA